MAILIVDDDVALCETLVDQLAVDGEFTAIAVGTISEAEEKLDARGARFDAVILDVRLPDGDGRDLCAKLRQQGQQIPIIMLTGRMPKPMLYAVSIPAPTTTSLSRSDPMNCWRDCGRRSAYSRTVRMQYLLSAPTRSARRPSCWRTRRGTAASGSPRRKLES